MAIIKLSGTATEFIDYAMLVVAILIVYYLLRLLLTFFGNDGRWGLGGGVGGVPTTPRVPRRRGFTDWIRDPFRTGRGGRDDDDEEEVVIGDDDPDFTPQLNQIETDLNNYDAQFNSFRTIGDSILTINQTFVASLSASVVGGAPRVSAAQWTSFYNALHILNAIAGNINSRIGALSAHPLFPRITIAQNNQFTDLCTRWAGYLGRTQDYNTDFGQRYARGDPPAP